MSWSGDQGMNVTPPQCANRSRSRGFADVRSGSCLAPRFAVQVGLSQPNPPVKVDGAWELHWIG